MNVSKSITYVVTVESFLIMGASVCGLSNFHGLMGRNLVGNWLVVTLFYVCGDLNP